MYSLSTLCSSYYIYCFFTDQKKKKKRGFSLPSYSPLCGNDEESIDHLCLNCPKIKGMCQVLFSFSVKSCFTPLSVKEMLEKWFTLPLGQKDSKLWRAVPVCLLWVIWKERNKIIFVDVTFSLDRVKSSFCNSFFLGLCLSWVRYLFSWLYFPLLLIILKGW